MIKSSEFFLEDVWREGETLTLLAVWCSLVPSLISNLLEMHLFNTANRSSGKGLITMHYQY